MQESVNSYTNMMMPDSIAMKIPVESIMPRKRRPIRTGAREEFRDAPAKDKIVVDVEPSPSIQKRAGPCGCPRSLYHQFNY